MNRYSRRIHDIFKLAVGHDRRLFKSGRFSRGNRAADFTFEILKRLIQAISIRCSGDPLHSLQATENTIRRLTREGGACPP